MSPCNAFVHALTAPRQLFKPQLPPDLYVNFRVALDRIIFTAIALHPTVSGPVAAMRNMRDRHVSATAGSWIGRTMYAAAQKRRGPLLARAANPAHTASHNRGAVVTSVVDNRPAEVLDMVEVECPIPSMSVGLAAMNAAYEQCYRLLDRLRIF